MGSKSIWSHIQNFFKFYTTTISWVFLLSDTLKAISKSLETVRLSFYRSKNKIWTLPKVFGTGPKKFELVQNSFRPIDGQVKYIRKNMKCNFKIILTPLCVWGESKGGQIYKFCLDFHHFSKRHSGVYVEFSLLEMWWFDDFFLIWLAHMYSFFLSSVLHNSQAINYVFVSSYFFYRTNISFFFL